MPQPTTVISRHPQFLPYRRERRARIAPRWRRRPGVLATVVVLAVVAWGALAALSAVRARREISAGVHALDGARTKTSETDIEQARAVPDLRVAAAQFGAARHRLHGSLLAPARLVPVIGRQLVSADDLAFVGATGSGAAADALNQAAASLRQPVNPTDRVGLIQRFLDLALGARQRLTGLDLGPRAGLLPALAEARNTVSGHLTRSLDTLDRGIAASRALLDLMRGSHDVLLLMTNNAEMRAGSGMANQLGLLQIRDGRFHLDDVRSVYDAPIPPGAVPATGILATSWSFVNPTGDWQELLASPRFDYTAPLAAKMWGAAGGPAVDAVMAIDPLLLRDALDVLGPVTVDGRTLTADTAIPELEHDQYVRLDNQSQTAQRHDEVADLARRVVGQLESGGWSPSRLGLRLATATRGRDLMVWSKTPSDEAGWIAAGAAGQLSPSSVMVSVLNRGRNKLDWFLPTATAVDLAPHGDQTDAVLTVTMDNRTPAAEPASVQGPTPGVEQVVAPGQTVHPGDYVGIVEFTLPAAAVNATIDGEDASVIQGADGSTVVIAEQYVIPARTTKVVRVRFRLPGPTGALVLEPAARQPDAAWTYRGVQLSATGRHVISW